MRKLALAVFFVFVISGAALAGILTPDLIGKLNTSSADELIPVNVTMTQQADPEQMQGMTAGLDKQTTRRLVVDYLNDLAQFTQTEVLSYLNSLQGTGKVDRITSLFIVNMVAVRATPDVVQRLAQFTDVDYVSYDPEHYMLADEPVPIGPVSPGIDETDEITWGVTDVHAPEVWNLGYNGANILVGILDTGVNYNHLDLATHMWNGGTQYPFHGWNFYSNNNQPLDNGPLGHGSHVAGTVASNGTAGTQAGVAPAAIIMAIKVWSGSGYGSLSQMISGINFAVQQNCDIWSMSGGISGGGSSSDKSQFRTACNNALAAGVIGTVAAGNESGTTPPNSCRVPGNVPPPWLHPNQTLTGGLSCVVSCGATQESHAIASFSSRGPCTWATIAPWNDYAYNPGMGLLRPDVAAPGVNTKSCDWDVNTGYVFMQGTSMATPHVAGVLALMLQKNNTLTPRQLDSILETTALDLGSAGKDNTFGAGLINALNAVNATPPGVPPNLSITMTPQSPPINIPANGGSFNFTAAVINNGPAQTPFYAWARDRNPNGTYTSTLLGPVSINPPVGVTVSRLRTQVVASTWPAGTHYYIGYAHTSVAYPATDADSFSWTKSAVADGGPVVWEAVNYGEPFPGEVMASAPASFSLKGAYPNPFNPTATINFTLPEMAKVSLNVYDVQGRQVAQLVNGLRQAGNHQVTFDGSNLASGVYLYTLTAGSHTATGKMMLMK